MNKSPGILSCDDSGELLIKKILKNAIFLNGFLYSKVGVVNMMREFTGQRELLRPTITRFEIGRAHV